jgi:hypothetical protein
MLLLTFRDLVYRRTRFLVVVVLGAVVFALLFVMTGIVEQFNTRALRRGRRDRCGQLGGARRGLGSVHGAVRGADRRDGCQVGGNKAQPWSRRGRI